MNPTENRAKNIATCSLYSKSRAEQQSTHESFTSKVLEVFHNDLGEQIYLHYGLDPSKGKKNQSTPFKEEPERTPSFQLNPNGTFHCYYSGNHGDGLNLIQLLHSCNFKQAIGIAASIYGIIDTPTHQYKPVRKKLKQKPQIEKGYEIKHITFREPNKKEAEFWEAKLNTTDLKAIWEYVKVIDSVTLYNHKKQKEQHYTGLKCVFAYEFIPNQKYKIYQPHFKKGRGYYVLLNQAKSVSLGLSVDYLKSKGVDTSYSLGFKELDLSKPVILVEGEADFLALKARGYNVFTLGSCQARLTKNISDKLQGVEKYTLFDTDYAGIKAAKNKRKVGFKMLTLPKLKKQTKEHFPKPVNNDVCDYLGVYGFDIDLEITLNTQYFKSPYRSKNAKRFILNEHQYLAHLIKHLEQPILNGRTILNSPCGTGKTTLIKALNKHTEKRILLAVPYMAITGQQREEVLAIDGTSTQEDRAAARHTKFVVCTYDSLAYIAPYFNAESDLLVVDEFHNLSLQGFRETSGKQVLTNVLGGIKTFKNVCLLSGTPNLLFESEYGFQVIEVSKKRGNKVDVKPVYYTSKLDEYLYSELVKADKEKITVIRLKSEQIKLFKKVCIEKGLYSENQIACIYNNDYLDTDTNWISLLKNNTLPTNVKLLLCTSKINDGVNVLNKNIGNVYFPYDNDYTSFIQFCARFRSIKQLPVYLPVKASKELKSGNIPNQSKIFRDYKELAELCKKANELSQRSDLFINHAALNTAFTANQNFVNDDYTFNEIAALIAVEKSLAKHRTKSQFLDVVSTQEGFTILEPDTFTLNTKNIDATALKQVKEEIKAEKEQAKTEVQEMFCNEHYLFFKILYHATKTRALKQQIRAYLDNQSISIGSRLLLNTERNNFLKRNEKEAKELASNFLFLFEYNLFESKEQVIEALANISSFKQFKEQAKTAILLDNYKRGNCDTRQAKDAELYLKDIEVLKSLDGDTIEGYKLRGLLNESRRGLHKVSSLDNDDMLKLLKMLCSGSIKRKRVRKDTRQIWVYEVKSLQEFINIEHIKEAAQLSSSKEVCNTPVSNEPVSTNKITILPNVTSDLKKGKHRTALLFDMMQDVKSEPLNSEKKYHRKQKSENFGEKSKNKNFSKSGLTS